MARVVRFEMLADDPERTAAFYDAALGWAKQKPEGMEEYFPVTTGS